MTLLLYILLCLIWGSTWMAIKIGLTSAPPLYASSFRFVVALAILYLIARMRKYRFPTRFVDFLRLGYPGLYIYGASYALIYFAEQYISSALTAILVASLPLFVAFLSYWVLKTERLHFIGWLGICFGSCGVVIIFYDSLQTSEHLFVGSLLALTGSLAAAYGTILHKKRSADHNIVIAVTVQMTLGLIPLLLAALVFESFSDLKFVLTTLGSVLYLAVFGTVVAFLSYYWLLARTRIVAVSLIAFITPLVAILIGVVGFAEELTVPIVIGTVMVLLAVLLVIRDQPKKTPNIRNSL